MGAGPAMREGARDPRYLSLSGSEKEKVDLWAQSSSIPDALARYESEAKMAEDARAKKNLDDAELQKNRGFEMARGTPLAGTQRRQPTLLSDFMGGPQASQKSGKRLLGY